MAIAKLKYVGVAIKRTKKENFCHILLNFESRQAPKDASGKIEITLKDSKGNPHDFKKEFTETTSLGTDGLHHVIECQHEILKSKDTDPGVLRTDELIGTISVTMTGGQTTTVPVVVIP